MLSLIIPARNAQDFIAISVWKCAETLNRIPNFPFEIILVPNSNQKKAEWDPTYLIGKKLEPRFPELRVVWHNGAPGKGAAIATGIRAARGDWIAFTDADCPYELDFLNRARGIIERKEASLVIGNRRDERSIYSVSVHALPYAWKRHRIGVNFNRVARLILDLPFRDTQAGIKAMSRDFAARYAAKQKCAGFLFDIELLLFAKANDAVVREETTELRLDSDLSTVNMGREFLESIRWLLKFRKLFRQGYYRC